MIIEASVAFSGRYKPRRARNWTPVELRSTTPARLDEICAEDAPIVLWYSPPQTTAAIQVAIRSYEGRLYQPLTEGAYRSADLVPFVEGSVRGVNNPADKDRNKPHVIDAERLVSLLAAGSPRVLNASLMYGQAHKGVMPRELDAAEIDLAEEARAKAGVMRLVRSFLLIDGIPYSVVELPLLTIDSNRKIATRHRDGLFNVDSYELGDIERLLAVAGDKEVIWDTSPPEILRPDLLPVVDHPLEADIAEVVRRILIGPTTGLDPANLGRESLETTLAWLSLRDGKKEGVPAGELLPRLERLANAASPLLMKPIVERARSIIARANTLRAHEDLAALTFDGFSL